MLELLGATPEFTHRTPEGTPLAPEFLDARWGVRRTYSDVWVTAYELEESPEEVAAAVLGFNKIAGLELVDPPYMFIQDKLHRCAEYVFGDIKDEPWAQRGWTVETTPELWQRPFQFLDEHGYMLVDGFAGMPAAHDVVAYGTFTSEGTVELGHFGIVERIDEEGEVLVVKSKLGQAPVARHNVNVISQRWGDRYWLLRK